MKSRTKWLLKLGLTALVLCMMALGGGVAHAQKGPTATEFNQLTKRIALLESEVAQLREQIESLLGSEDRYTVQQINLGQSPVKGSWNAPITLVMFGDYQSDYTARAQFVVDRLLGEFKQDLRYVFKHYPLTQQHPFASEAALASLASEGQNLFWEFHALLLKNSRRLDSTQILVLAGEAGLELPTFEEGRRSITALSRLSADEKEATRLGVSGVPAVYLNGRLMKTWRYDYLKSQVEEIRKRLGKG